MKRFFYHLHHGLGLIIGALLTLICLTGATMVFEEEWRELASPRMYFVQGEPSGERLSPSAIVERVQTTLTDNTVVGISISADTTRNYILSLQKGNDIKLYVDPYTAEVVGRREKRDGFFGDVMRLHRFLLDPSKTWGKAIVGYGVLGFILIVISGLVIGLPLLMRSRGKRTASHRSPSTYQRYAWLHRSLGIGIALPVLILAITGLNWAFPWWRSGLYGLFGTEYNGGKKETKKDPEAPLATIDYRAWSLVAQQLETRHHWRSMTIKDGEAEVAEQAIVGNMRAAELYQFDASTGQITGHTPYQDQPLHKRLRGWIYTIHTGAWAGWLSKTLTFVVVLLTATLPLTGYYMYWQRRRVRRTRARGK